jgi:flagellar motor switch protein FliM
MSGKDTLSQAEIDALLAAVAADPKDADADGGGGGRAKRIQNMDFRRPSKFNKDQLHTLEMLHDTFSRLGGTYLSSALRCMTDITVLGAEQVTYGEFIASLPVPALTAILELEPLGTNAICAVDLPLVFSMIDRLLGGAGAATYRLRELTDIELSLSRTVVTRLLDELSTSWNELVGVDFRLRQTEMNPQFAQIAPPTELSVLLSFQIRIHESSGVMALCLPYRSIESVAPSLTTQSYFSGQRAVDPSFSLAGGLQGVDIELRAEVGAIDLRIDDVLALRPGDIVPLGIPVEEGVRLMAGQHEVYRAFPGAYQRHLAVQVTERTGVAIGSARGLASAPAPEPDPDPVPEELAA